MFSIDEKGAITMHRGDTGAFLGRASREDGEDFVTGDVALFTVRNGAGANLIEREYALDDDEGLGNGRFLVVFHNYDTDDPELWPAGTYQTEMRVVVHPYRDANGVIIDGDIVRVPENGQSTLVIEEVYRKV